jgi:hypothetical protein
MRNLLFMLISFLIISCGAHFPLDVHPNQAINGYHSIEFDVTGVNGFVTKEMGLANIFLKKNEDYDKINIIVYGIYKGTLNLISNACSIDLKINFEGNTKFNLKELIPEPLKCSIRVIATTDQIGRSEHLIIESGLIKINTIGEFNTPLEISYLRSDSFSQIKKYSFFGQGSLQRIEGPLSNTEKITVSSKLKDGGLYRVVGCGNELVGEFSKSSFDLNFKDFYKKDFLTRQDTCDLEILVIPNSEEFSHQARFSLSIYGKEVVQLENLKWDISKGNLNVEGNRYVAVCSINDSYVFKKNERRNIKCSQKYSSDKVYWVRGITTNGRKSVFAIKNNSIIWSN